MKFSAYASYYFIYNDYIMQFDANYNIKRHYDKVHLIYVNDEVYTVHDHVLNRCHYFKKLLSGNFNDKEIRLEVDEKFNFTVVVDVLYNDQTLQWFEHCSCDEYIQMILMLEFLQYDFIKKLLPLIKQNVTMNNPASDVKSIVESDISLKNKELLLFYYMERNMISLEFIENRGVRPITKREQTNIGPPVSFVDIIDGNIKTDNIINFFEQYNIKINSYKFTLEREFTKSIWRSLNYCIKLYIDDELIHEDRVDCYDVIDIIQPMIRYAIKRVLKN